MKVRGTDLQSCLPGPRGLELEHTRRSLVRTHCWTDPNVCQPGEYLWGTGFFIDVGKREEDDPPCYILTSSLNCGHPNQTVLVGQGRIWATAEVVAWDHKVCVTLLKVNQPDRFTTWKRTSEPLPLADLETAAYVEQSDALEAVVIGYHHWLPDHRFPFQSFLPAYLQADWVGANLAVKYTPRWRGSPLVTEEGVIGLAIGYSSPDEMDILRLPRLLEFLRAATEDISESVPGESVPGESVPAIDHPAIDGPVIDHTMK